MLESGMDTGQHGMTGEDGGTDAGVDSFEAELARNRALEPEFLGLELAQAQALADQLDLELRVIDDEHTMLTLDLRPRRMTVDVRTGTVSRATVG
ncbi:MAG: hypothetical protein ACJ74U_04135 [Jatrophihabitantaceae bacterium]